MGDITEHFSRREFACPCCGLDNVNLTLVHQLEQARVLLGEPIRISSGVRCAKHNAEVGGVKDSAHLAGLAADIACSSSHSRYELLMAILTVAFRRLEDAPDHIHVDIDQTKPQDVCVFAGGGK